MVVLESIPVTIADLHEAAGRLRDVVIRTPLLYSHHYSHVLGLPVYLKLECLQRTGAFKLRGAYNKIASLSPQARARGLVAASSGNHAQGLAYAARAFGVDAQTTIFMPEATPHIKIENTQRHGRARIELVAGNYDQASEQAHALAEATAATYIEPYNDWDIIAGQGTVGLEIIAQLPDVRTIVVPVGGGGLCAGIALAAHDHASRARVVGVGANFEQRMGYTVADGIRVKQVGGKPEVVLRQYVEDVVRVDEADIARTVGDFYRRTHVVAEGAGVTGLAALVAGRLANRLDGPLVVVISGGNIDPNRLRELQNL